MRLDAHVRVVISLNIGHHKCYISVIYIYIYIYIYITIIDKYEWFRFISPSFVGPVKQQKGAFSDVLLADVYPASYWQKIVQLTKHSNK